MPSQTPTSLLCHWSTLVNSTENVDVGSNDHSHRVVIREWPDRPQVDVVHEQRLHASDNWQPADIEEVHPLVHRGVTTLCTWTETTYHRGFVMPSHRHETEHRVVIRPVETGNGLKVVHERRGPDEDTWTTVDDHHLAA